MVSKQTAFNTITINAAEQDHLIDSVTVFQAGRAEIKRRVQLKLKQGQNRINIEHLPNCMDRDSIWVQGSGTAVIFDVVYHSPYRQPTPDPSTDGEESDEESNDEYHCSLQTLRKERNVVKQQSDFLDSYGRTLNSQNFGLDDIERFLDIYATRQSTLEQRTQEIDLQIGRLEKALGKGQAKKPLDDYYSLAERRTKITVTVLSKEHGKAELLLTYVVSRVNWTPIYDVRASLGQSPGKSSTVEPPLTVAPLCRPYRRGASAFQRLGHPGLQSWRIVTLRARYRVVLSLPVVHVHVHLHAKLCRRTPRVNTAARDHQPEFVGGPYTQP
ncbi:Protein F37C4,5 [Ceratobasidium theobromae]|uniref:Protein F37C4,5 n=1 Tax=Ceratobasidium theobromae TaxID=1582974 RepID=A0A5N5Q6T4_9AGAM|nr:Protein F37C4,5 [Ceratobasidium theobromae]